MTNIVTKLFIASDHAAFTEKAKLITFLQTQKYAVEDLGTHSEASCHYPVYAKALCEKMHGQKNTLGILLCGSGIGVSMVANRYQWVRAARCCNEQDAKMAKAHNDANVLCLGSRVNTVEEMQQMITTWLNTKFEGGRHLERVQLFSEEV